MCELKSEGFFTMADKQKALDLSLIHILIHMATMQALVIGVERNRLFVLDFSTRRRLIVNTPSARRFHRGDIVRIRYNGVMTASIPPQILSLIHIFQKYLCPPGRGA